MHLSSRQVKQSVLVLTLLGATGAAVFAAGGSRLILNGKIASSDVRVINGAAYVKVADVARALGMVVVKRSDGYEIKKAGGASPITGVTQGKVGDVLFDGKWRLQVLSVQVPESFTMKTSAEPSTTLYDVSNWDQTRRVLTPKTGYKLVVIQCRVTNGQNSRQTLWTAPRDDNVRTALADMDGSSHTPIAYDFEGGPMQTKPLVPGAIITFPVVFSVPQDTRLKDLIFTLKTMIISRKVTMCASR
jgi:hypothetical protein